VRDRRTLDRDVLPFFRDAPLGRLVRADLQQWVDKFSKRFAPSTVRRTYVVLDQLLALAVERGLIVASPADGVRLPRIVRSESRFLTAPELERLALTIDRRYRAMVLVMAWATLRLGEASGLRRRRRPTGGNDPDREQRRASAGAHDRRSAENESASSHNDASAVCRRGLSDTPKGPAWFSLCVWCQRDATDCG
jgi:hypothetical protein